MQRGLWIIVGLVLAQGVPPQTGGVWPWRFLETGPIQVYYWAGQEALANEVALYATDAYEELVRLLDYRLEKPLVLRLHPTLVSYAEQPVWATRGALSSPANMGEVCRLPDYREFVGQVRAEVAVLYLMQFYYGPGMRFQSRTLLYLPEWFYRGFAFFFGEGWTVADRARLAGWSDRLLEAIWERRAFPRPVYRTAYKAIWYYLLRTYGQKKLGDLVYMVRLTRQVSEALYLTLGLSEEELTQRWLAFISELRAGESALEPVIRGAVLGAAAGPNGQVAYAKQVGGRIRFYVRLAEGSVQELPGSFSWPLSGSYYEFLLPMAFSGGGRLAWLSYDKAGVFLWSWDGREAPRMQRLALKGVSDLSWLDEERLLLTGWEEGPSQVYEVNRNTSQLRRLTQVPGDKRYPFRARDGGIEFVWQADSSGQVGFREVWRPYGWARLEGGRLVWKAWEPFYGWGAGWLAHREGRLVGRDLTGWWQTWVVASDTAYESSWLAPGLVQWVGADASRAYFLFYRGGAFRVGAIAWDTLLKPGRSYPTIYAAERVQLDLQRQARYPLSPVHKLPPLGDTVAADTPRRQRGPFYFFDEEAERPRRRRRAMPPIRMGREVFLPDSIRISGGEAASSQVLWEGLRLIPVLHPLMRLGLHLEAQFVSFSGRYRWFMAWRPYVDFRSSEGWLGVERSVGRVQPFFRLHRQSHYFSESRYLQGLRLLSWQAQGGFRYYFSTSTYVSLEGLALFVRRYDLILRDNIDYNAMAQWVGARLGWQHVYLEEREGFIWAGRELALTAEGFPKGSVLAFGRLFLKGTYHQPLLGRLVLTASAQAVYGSRAAYQPIILGGVPDWVNYTIENRAQLPLLEPLGAYYLSLFVPMPGFAYHTRRGRNLLWGQVLLRAPLLALSPAKSLPVRRIYTLEWHAGYYIATTWRTGNPFSQKNPIDAEYIYRPPLVISVQTLKSPFLMSVGTGLTFRVMQLPIALDFYWPIEEGRLGRAQFLVGLRSGLR